MPHLSAFTPCGMLTLSSAPSKAELFYEQLKQLYGGNAGLFSFLQPSHDEAKLYAWAMGLARVANELEHAGNQAKTFSAYDLIPLLELDYELTPGPKDGVVDRQRAIAAAKLASSGAVASNVVNGLRALLGANFLAYVVATPSGANAWTATTKPTSPGNGPGNFPDVRIPAKRLQLVNPVVQTGLQWCAYQNWDTTESPVALYPGDVVTVEGESSAVAEKVTVVDAAASPPSGSNAGPGACFKASFTKGHGIGASITSGSFPFWWGTQRSALVVVTAAAANDAPTRRKVNEFMRRVARGVSTWAIAQPTSTSGVSVTLGPFTVGTPMGTKTLAAMTVQKSG